MIRKKTGFKELTIAVLCGAALVSVACGDDDATDGDASGGSAGSAGSSAAGSKSTGGSAGTKSTGGSAGTGTGGTSAGTSGGGSGGSAGSSVGGEPNGGVPSDGGTDGEGGTPSEAGAGGALGGAGGEGGSPEVVLDTLLNVSFETWNADKTIVDGWTNTSTPAGASYAEWGTAEKNKAGEYRLAHWSNVAYTARTEQVVSPIANGNYSFSIWVSTDDLDMLNASYIYAKDFDGGPGVTKTTEAAVGTTYVEIKLDNIKVESGKITVGVYTDADADGWVNFDAASLVRLPD